MPQRPPARTPAYDACSQALAAFADAFNRFPFWEGGRNADFHKFHFFQARVATTCTRSLALNPPHCTHSSALEPAGAHPTPPCAQAMTPVGGLLLLAAFGPGALSYDVRAKKFD